MGEIRITPNGLALLGGRLCLDFCNTVERAVLKHDMLLNNKYAGLMAWCQEAEVITPALKDHYLAWAAASPQAAQTLFERAMELREAIFQVGLASIKQDAISPEALAILNSWTQQAMSARVLSPSSSGRLAWQWRDETAPEKPLWEVTLSAVDVLLNEDLNRLRQCPGCGWLFYDQTKNNTRTWCDMRFCGNRAKNKRFHARQKQSEA